MTAPGNLPAKGLAFGSPNEKAPELRLEGRGLLVLHLVEPGGGEICCYVGRISIQISWLAFSWLPRSALHLSKLPP